METDAAQVLADIFSNIDVFALVFLRLVGFMAIAPLFSGPTFPAMAKAGFGLSFAALTVLSGAVTAPVVTGDIVEYFAVIAGEFFTGFMIGFIVYLMFAVFYYVGQLSDYQIGFSMVSVMDPMNEVQAPITGNLYYFVFLAFFVVSGGLHGVLLQLFNTYELIPPGKAFIIGNTGLLTHVFYMMGGYFELGLKIAMPVIAAIIVIDVVLGVLVKASPQMNVFAVGMPVKVGVGLIIMWLMAPVMEDLMYRPFEERLFQNLYDVIRGLAPRP
jgi:flagellar biosynthetic protein FliR